MQNMVHVLTFDYSGKYFNALALLSAVLFYEGQSNSCYAQYGPGNRPLI